MLSKLRNLVHHRVSLHRLQPLSHGRQWLRLHSTAAACPSPYSDVRIPDDTTLPDFVLSRTFRYGDRPALVDHVSGRVLTYEQLGRQAWRVACALQERGLRKGERVALLAPNMPEFPVALLGVTMAGGVVTPVNPSCTTKELQHQVSDAGARYLFTTPELLYHLAGLSHIFKDVYVFGEAEGEAGALATPFAELLEPRIISALWEQHRPRTDVAVLPYSSGTTGRPKGVCLTHRNLIANLRQFDNEAFNRLSHWDAVLGLLPFSHIYGLTVALLASLLRGSCVVTVPKFEPATVLEALQRHRIAVGYVVPPVVQFLATSPAAAQYDLSRLRDLVSGAAPLGLGPAQACARRLRVSVRQVYGLTEAGPVSHVLPFEAVHKHRSVGRLVSNMALRIVDPDTGAAVPRGATGELLVRGPNVMSGYLHAPEGMASVIDGEGYLHTGDLGYMDEDGDCYIVDRCKEVIKSKGFQVAPSPSPCSSILLCDGAQYATTHGALHRLTGHGHATSEQT